jgi:hypothetical protein
MPIIGTSATRSVPHPEYLKPRHGRSSVLTEEWVLVGSSDHLESIFLLVVAEPSPARTLDTGGLGVHLFLERLERAEILLDLVEQWPRGWRLG